MRKTFGRAMACLGAVIGAGFASGREIVSFFSRYSDQAVWLIGLAAAVMTFLCWLCMDFRVNSWHALFEKEKPWIRNGARLCVLVLLALTGGAMLSAAGHVCKLVFPWAYSVGAAGTLMLAWRMGKSQLRAMSLLSTALSVVFVAAIAASMALSESAVVQLPKREGGLSAALGAIGYAGMNMTLAIGVVCRCSEPKRNGWTALVFGAMMLALMLLSHRLYVRHPEWMQSAFPIVGVLSGFGQGGFWLSAALIYLAVFTSLAAVLCALQTALNNPWMAMGLPLLVSFIGFEGIVDTLYAPAGILCLMAVFAPLVRRKFLTRSDG